MKAFTLIAALLSSLLVGCSKDEPETVARTNLFYRVYFGQNDTATHFQIGYDFSEQPSNNWPRDIYMPSNYTGTVRIGTNVIWPVKTP